MGKRGMQSKEAMGVDSQEMLAHQLGHTKQKHHDVSINAKAAPAASKAAAAAPQPAAAPPPPKKMSAEDDFQRRQKLKGLLSMAEEGLNSRFSDMYKAFQSIDLDRSGRLSKKEISRALDLWNVPISDDDLDFLLADCDQDGDGGVSYTEFVDKLARGTVAPAAMGKRGMQSKEAMGVDSQEMLAHQLGHTKQKHHNISINA